MAEEQDMQSSPGLESIEEHTLIMSHVHRLQSSYHVTFQSSEMSEVHVQKTTDDLCHQQEQELTAADENSSTDIHNILASLCSADGHLNATTLEGLVIDEEQLTTQPENLQETRVEDDLQVQDFTFHDSGCGQVESEQTQLIVDKIEITTMIQREKDAEHELIHHYTSKMMHNSDNNMEDQNVAPHNGEDKIRDSVQQQQQQQLLVLRTRILELRRKIAEVKEIQKLQKDIDVLEENIAAEQQKRTDLTQSRDELMKLLKARNSLWRSPTMSQAASELSIDQQLLTPTSADFEFFNTTDIKLDHQSRDQIEQLQQQLEQMVRGCNTDSDVVIVTASGEPEPDS